MVTPFARIALLKSSFWGAFLGNSSICDETIVTNASRLKGLHHFCIIIDRRGGMHSHVTQIEF